MSIQQIVDPEKIEPELIRLWETLAKEKMRACLFNLIVFNELSSRTDYIRKIVQKVSEKYPCRVLFITCDLQDKKTYLKTAVSVVGTGNIACDYIDIGVSFSESEKVPFLLLPHLVPDLPITLLWTEDPTRPHPLLTPLIKLAHRIIFDSESADSLYAFSQKTLSLHQDKIDTADLNWARTEGWRELIVSLFRSSKKFDQISSVEICYNGEKTESFYHPKIQAIYVLSWLASCLNWNYVKVTNRLEFTFKDQKALIQEGRRKKVGPGAIISLTFKTKDGSIYTAERSHDQPHHVTIHTSSKDACEMPYQFVLGETASGQSLTREIVTKGTSKHYIQTLEAIQSIDKDALC